MICRASQLTVFYIMATLALNELKGHDFTIDFSKQAIKYECDLENIKLPFY